MEPVILKETDFYKIADELRRPADEEIRDPRIKVKADSLLAGAPLAVNHEYFRGFVETLSNLGVAVGEMNELKVHLEHDIGREEKFQDIFGDITLPLVSSSELSGMPPPLGVSAFAIPHSESKLAESCKRMLDGALSDGHIIMLIGAGIDPIYIGLSLDRFYSDKLSGLNLEQPTPKKVIPSKRYLAVSFAVTPLLWQSEYFEGALCVSELLKKKMDKISAITTNWSHSLERHGTPNIKNIRKLDYDASRNLLHIGPRDLSGILPFLEDQHQKHKLSPYWVFATGTNIRTIDYGLFLADMLINPKCRGLIVNNIDDRPSFSKILETEYGIREYPFLAIYESAPILLRSLSLAYA